MVHAKNYETASTFSVSVSWPSSNNQVTEWEEIISIYIDQANNDFITPDKVCE